MGQLLQNWEGHNIVYLNLVVYTLTPNFVMFPIMISILILTAKLLKFRSRGSVIPLSIPPKLILIR